MGGSTTSSHSLWKPPVEFVFQKRGNSYNHTRQTKTNVSQTISYIPLCLCSNNTILASGSPISWKYPLFPNIHICSQILERSQGRSRHYLGLPGAFNPIGKTSPQLGHLHMECPKNQSYFKPLSMDLTLLETKCYWDIGPSVRLIASLSTCFGSTTQHFPN